MPRNRELMRVFRDLDLVEHLGSGMNRILKAYDRSIFKLSENFLEIVFPFAEDYFQSIEQVTPQVKKLVNVILGEMSRDELQDKLKLKDRKSFVALYLIPALEAGWVTKTILDKPNSRFQKYKLTAKGIEFKKQLSGL